MENAIIIDINKNSNDNFNNILAITKETLNKATAPFFALGGVENSKEFVELLRYDYTSLYTTVVFNLLNMLNVTYGEKLPKYKIAEIMPSVDTGNLTEEELNRKRLRRIEDLYLTRNEEHAEYFNSPTYKPRMLVADSLWYNLLSEFPIIKRFLHKKEAIITKNFFSELNLIYSKINEYTGYEHFYLMHKLETNSKIEMFYKILTLIKRQKRSKKLSNLYVLQMIDDMSKLHLIPLNELCFELVFNNVELNEVYNEIAGVLPFQMTVNSIVFNTDKLVDCYIENAVLAADFINALNLINNAVVFHLCVRIENELAFPDKFSGFEFVNSILHCDAATKFFDEFTENNTFVNINKNCTEDITFTHFKRIYKLKTEK